MGGEDFSYMLQARPGAYVFLGQGGGPDSCFLHNPNYDFNDEVIPLGAGYLAALVEDALASSSIRGRIPVRRLLLVALLRCVAAPVHAVDARMGGAERHPDARSALAEPRHHALDHAVRLRGPHALQQELRDRALPRGELEADLADTHWRFNLRKGVKFHDGSPFTADDVVFSFGRIKQPQGTNQIYVTGIKEVKKVDDYTVDFILAGPTPILLRNIVDFRIMSKAWSEKNRSQNVQDYAKKEETYASRNANGTGPYIIKSWEPDKRSSSRRTRTGGASSTATSPT